MIPCQGVPCTHFGTGQHSHAFRLGFRTEADTVVESPGLVGASLTTTVSYSVLNPNHSVMHSKVNQAQQASTAVHQSAACLYPPPSAQPLTSSATSFWRDARRCMGVKGERWAASSPSALPVNFCSAAAFTTTHAHTTQAHTYTQLNKRQPLDMPAWD